MGDLPLNEKHSFQSDKKLQKLWVLKQSMRKPFVDVLIEKIHEKQSIICVGLDPRLDGLRVIPAALREEFGEDNNALIFEYMSNIIRITADLVPIFKPQIAYYEAYDALDALKRLISLAHSLGCLVLVDAKRNDIGSTSEAYASYVFDHLNADACTINAYFGIDGVQPFLNYASEGKGVFALVKTSNKSSQDFQDLFALDVPESTPDQVTMTVQGEFVVKRNYLKMAELVHNWGNAAGLVGESGYSCLGGVVGATFPTQLDAVRETLQNNFILIPGYGAQGGTAEDILKGLNQDGLGAIVNSSRGINYAYSLAQYSQYSEREYAEAARQAVMDMNLEIEKAIGSLP